MCARIEDAAQQWSGVDSNPRDSVLKEPDVGKTEGANYRVNLEESVDRALPRPVSPPRHNTRTKGSFIEGGKRGRWDGVVGGEHCTQALECWPLSQIFTGNV